MAKNKSKSSFQTNWDQIAQWWDDEAGERGILHQRLDVDPVVIKLLGKVKNKKILEVGCGNGYLARRLALTGAEVVAIDLSQKFLDLALAKLREQKNPLGVRFLNRNASNLRDLRSNYFDLAVANMSIMDIADAQRAITEIARVLKESGRLIFSLIHPVFNDFRQHWVTFQVNGKKLFGRVITRYLSDAVEKPSLDWGWGRIFRPNEHHRSIEKYIQYLRQAGLVVSDLQEVKSKRPLEKASPKEDTRQKLFQYRTLAEKRMKLLARREIPCFLVIGAQKITR